METKYEVVEGWLHEEADGKKIGKIITLQIGKELFFLHHQTTIKDATELAGWLKSKQHKIVLLKEEVE
jgi:hypothetical protein